MAAAVAVGFVDGIFSGFLASEAHKEMAHAAEMMHAVRRSHYFIDIGKIKNIRFPVPAHWSASGNYGERLIHSSDPFILVQTAAGQQMNIMIQHIVSYEVIR